MGAPSAARQGSGDPRRSSELGAFRGNLTAGEATDFCHHELTQPAVRDFFAAHLMPDHVDWHRREYQRHLQHTRPKLLLHEGRHTEQEISQQIGRRHDALYRQPVDGNICDPVAQVFFNGARPRGRVERQSDAGSDSRAARLLVVIEPDQNLMYVLSPANMALEEVPDAGLMNCKLALTRSALVIVKL